MGTGVPTRIGRYEILEPIGSGGMGEVFLGRTKLEGGIEKRVAIKRVHPMLAADEELSDMFLEEARLSTVLEHPNIVHVGEVGSEDGNLFIVMTYLEGSSLAKLSRRMSKHRSAWPVGAAIEVVLGVLAGLSHAHGRRGYDGENLSIVHRDISPQNVFVTFEGIVKVLDFGIAKAANSRVVTTVGQRKGKSGYMAPEQEKGLPVDARADIYAAAVVLYELLTGQKPHPPLIGNNGVLTPRTGPPTPVASLRSNVPSRLDSVLRQALSEDPGRRFQTASAFRDALEDVCTESSLSRGSRQLAGLVQRFAPRGGGSIEELPTRVRTPPKFGTQEPAAATQVDVGAAPVVVAARSGPRWTTLLAASLIVIAAGGLAYGVASSRNRAAPPAAPASEPTAAASASALAKTPLADVPVEQLKNLLSETRPERALDPAARARIVAELEHRVGNTDGVNMPNQTTLDLLQLERASDPCRVLEAALRRIEAAPDRTYLPGLVHASSWLDGDGGARCSQASEQVRTSIRTVTTQP